MMDQYVTFGDLLKICSVLLSLANLIVYIFTIIIKIVIRITTARKRNNRPSYQLAAVKS